MTADHPKFPPTSSGAGVPPVADHKSQCEAEHGTAHLPDDVRSMIYAAAWDHGHSYGESEVMNLYPDHAELALAAYAAGRAQVATKLRKWADDMGTPEWREGWEAEINAARTFAGQIESGSL